jgi:hypothetical protein
MRPSFFFPDLDRADAERRTPVWRDEFTYPYLTHEEHAIIEIWTNDLY